MKVLHEFLLKVFTFHGVYSILYLEEGSVIMRQGKAVNRLREFIVPGQPPPVSAVPKIWAEEAIGEILAAAAGALRVLPSDVRKQGPLRGLFIHLAWRHGWRQPALLARICGMGPRAVHLVLNQAPPPGLEAADLCLGDRRLRRERPFASFGAAAAELSSSSAVDDAEARGESSLRV